MTRPYFRDEVMRDEAKHQAARRPITHLPPVPAFHLDMDSFFATAEQQARPHLRGKPVGISIAPSRGGTIIAASQEAKLRGVGTGTRVGEARLLIPDLTILPPDPAKYRMIHRAFRTIIEEYSEVLRPRSIDEVAFWPRPVELQQRDPLDLAAEIKQRIRDEVGEWLSSTIGVGPNWFLAKTACSMAKPDGLKQITKENTRENLGQLELTDLCGIARRMAARFQLAGLPSPVAIYDLPPWELKRKFGIIGYYWHRRLHGYTIDVQDLPTKSFGHSSVIPKATNLPHELRPLLQKLSEKLGRRMRREGYRGRMIWIGGSMQSPDRSRRLGWGRKRRVGFTDDGHEIFRNCWEMFHENRPFWPLRKLVVTVSEVESTDPEQLSFFQDPRRDLLKSLDLINDRWGEYTVAPASMKGAESNANDSIAFGQDMVKEARTL